MKETTQQSYRDICSQAPLGYASLMRWRRRARFGEPLVRSPGPEKLGPLPLGELRQELARLDHGPRRTAGTGELWQRFEIHVSRRQFQEFVDEARREAHRRAREQMRRIEWTLPGLAWAVDATEWKRDLHGQKLHGHDTQDLASRCHFEPMVELESRGGLVAPWLDESFDKHGAPLLLKRDNGGPFNTPEVDEVLAAHSVIPLNSPPRYPRYNGGKERGIREIKAWLAPRWNPPRVWEPSLMRPWVLAAVDALNHLPRPCLGGRHACHVHATKRARWTRSERANAFSSISDRYREIILRSHDRGGCSRTAAWRHAVEAWLECQGLIAVYQNQEVLPDYPQNRSH